MRTPNEVDVQPETFADSQTQTLFDIPSAAKHFQEKGAKTATKNFVRNLIASGQLPHLRIGKRFYVTKAAIDRWIETREKRNR
jgi:excisionase family DNA binding protein